MIRENLLTGVRLWGVRRVPTATAGSALLVVLGVVLLWFWNWMAALAAAFAVGASLRRHADRAANEPAPHPRTSWMFGGERLPYRSVSEVLDARPREIMQRLAARYRPGETVELVLWVVARDGTGQPWTLVQDRFGGPVPSVTASAVGMVAGACDPYLEAQRLSLSEIGLALSDVIVIGWGTDRSLDAARDTIIVVGQTTVGAEELGSVAYPGDNRRSHLVELHPDSVARSLTSVDARRWQAAAVRGLVRCIEMLYPGSGPLLGELVADPWRNKRMFTRLGRLTDAPADDGEQTPVVHPVVLKVVDGGLTEAVEERTVTPIRRALSWENTSRPIPTRYA